MIEWIWDNQLAFFALLFFQYAALFEFQALLKKRKLFKPLVILFLIQDWIMNLILSVWFLDLPERLGEVVTGRLKRYKAHGGYSESGVKSEKLELVRYKFAIIVCKALNVWDKDHC